MRIIIGLLFLLLFIESCSSDGYLYTQKNKIKYQLIELSIDEIALSEGDFVAYSLQIFNSSNEPLPFFKDSILTTHLISNDDCVGNVNEVMLELNQGDSVKILIKAIDFFNCQGWEFPAILDANEMLTVHLKIRSVASELSILNKKKLELQLLDSLAIQVDSIVKDWKTISDTIIVYENMYIAILDSCAGESVVKGNKVKIVHQTIRLNGRVIENSTEEEPFEFIAGQQDQVIDGVRIAIGYMCFGQHAKILIPHQYSFSESFRNQLGIYKDPIICDVHLLQK